MHRNSNVSGRVASLHLHPAKPGAPFSEVSSIHVVADKGIEGNPRYFGRISQNGTPGRRQVTLIERSQIMEHADKLGLKVISPGTVRSNIETDGINLIELIGQKVQIGSAILFFYEARLPCAKMDAICTGLRKLMENNKQGVLAQVIATGTIAVGDRITFWDDQLSGELHQ